MGKVNRGAETTAGVSAGFGLIGALVGAAATSGATSEIQTDVLLEPVILTDVSSGQMILKTRLHAGSKQMQGFRAADSAAIFSHPDVALKDAVNQLIRELGSAPGGLSRP